MIKKIMSIVLTLAMLCSVVSVSVFANSEPVTYNVTSELSCSAATVKKNVEEPLFGKDTSDTYNSMSVVDVAAGGQAFPSAKIANSGSITAAAGDKVKVSFQMAVDHWDYLASDTSKAKVLDVGLTGKSYAEDYNIGKNATCVGFDYKAGSFYNFGINITGYKKQFVPVNNWATYEIVYTIGGNGSTKDKVSVYVDGKPYIENFTTNTYIKTVTGINMRTEKISRRIYLDNMTITHYPATYTGTVVSQNLFNENNLSAAGFNKLPDGTLHYIGTGINTASLEGLVNNENTNIVFVQSADSSDNGRIGYLKMTASDGTQQFKKVVSGNAVDILKLDFDDRLSLADETTGKLVTTSNKEGGYMNTMKDGQDSKYELSYKSSLMGKDASNYALEYKPTNLDTANAYWGTYFSSIWKDSSYSASAMSASGIVSYEFSLRLPEGNPSGKINAEVYLETKDNEGTIKKTAVSPLQVYNDYLYYNKNDMGFGGVSAPHGYEQLVKKVEADKWQRYAVIVNTIDDEISVYRNGVLKYESQPKKSTGEVYNILSTSNLNVYGINLNTSVPKSTFQIDDVVIRSVSADYVPEKFDIEVAAGRIDTQNGILRTTQTSAAELLDDLALSDGQVMHFEDAAYTTSSAEDAVGEYAIIKNADETIIYYVKIVEQDMIIEGMDLTDKSASEVRILEVEITNYTENIKKAVLILAGYKDGELVCISAMDAKGASTYVSVKGTNTLKAELTVPADSNVTKVKAFLWDDENGYAPLTLSSETK